MHDAESHAALQHDAAAPANHNLADFRLAVAADDDVLIGIDDERVDFRAGHLKLSRAGDGQNTRVHSADFRMSAACKDQMIRRERTDLFSLRGHIQIGVLQLARRGERFVAIDHRAEHAGKHGLHLLCGHGVLRRNVLVQIVPCPERIQRTLRLLAQQAADVLRRVLPRLHAAGGNRRAGR